MTHDPTRDCEHGRLKGKCDVCDLQEENKRLTELLNNPEEHYPGNFDTPQRANALLTGLCQDAAKEIAKLQAEVLEQCRINGMSAEREDALRAELTRLKASIALDKKAENARELGLNYDTPLSAFVRSSDEDKAEVMERVIDKAIEAQKEKIGCVNHDCDQCKAVQEPVAWTDLLKQAEEVVRSKPLWKKYIDGTPLANDIAVWMASFAQAHTTPPAPQPVPVKTYHDGKPWPVAPKPWVGLTDEEVEAYDSWADFQVGCGRQTLFDMVRDIEAKLKEKNT
jgi:hypothetical protein